MGVGCGYVASWAGLIRSQGLAVMGCGSGLMRVRALAGLGGFDGCGLGFGAVGVAMPVGVRVGVLRLPVRLVSAGRGLAWRPAAVAVWVTGLGGGAAGWGIRNVVLCGALGSWVAVGAAAVGAATLVGWRGGVCSRGWASGDVPQAYAVSLRLLRTYGWSWGAGRLQGWTPRGWSASASMASRAACGIHPPRRLEAAVLR